MSSSELRRYIEMVNEEELNDQLYEMARVSARQHGIPDVVIWVGETNKRHGLRVKVSNAKNKFDPNDNFVIQMPSLDYDHTQVAKWITNDTMEKILTWIKLNQKLLYDYETGLIQDTQFFLDNVVKEKGETQ